MTAAEQHLEQARSFGAGAAVYQQGRPGYPDAAVDWLLASGPRRVLDLGAGSGQLTRSLLQRDLDVTAVEPSDEMRDLLRREAPGATILAGAGEQIPLPHNSMEAVLVAQAWHWVRVEQAVPEVARVLSPGGVLGLIWNIRDERHDWVAELGRLMHRGIEQDMHSENPSIGAPFGPVDRFDVEWEHPLTRSALLDLVASRSYVITLLPHDRAALLERIRRLIETHPDLVGREQISMPYIARCSKALLA